MAEPLTIDVVSDVMCPWCWIGKRRLAKALELVEGVPVSVRWRPYQLDPTLPPEGKDRRRYLEEKFGGPDRAAEIYARIGEAGAAEGLPMALDAIAVSPNTLDAHRLVRWAANEGEDTQERVVEMLFEAFFAKAENIAEHDVLVRIAEDAGMQAKVVRDLLATDADRAATLEEIAKAQAMGVQGVPCYILADRYAVTGAQDPETLANAIRQVAAETVT